MLGRYLHRILTTTKGKHRNIESSERGNVVFQRIDLDSSNTDSELRDVAVCLQEKRRFGICFQKKHSTKNMGLLFIPFSEEKCYLPNQHHLREKLGTSALMDTSDVEREPLDL